jgi:hypothetical protein
MERRETTKKEYRIMQRIFKLQSPPSKTLKIIWKFGMSVLLNYQVHLIARIADTTHVTIDNICVHDEFSKCLKTKLNWSKNMQQERDAP